MAQTTLELIDQTESLLSKDASRMHRLVDQFPEMLATPVVTPTSPIRAGSPPRAVFFSGMGGSGIVGDMMGEVIRRETGIFASSVKDYHLPPGIFTDALLICVSHSGNTEETLSAYREGRERNLRCIVITSGGKLREAAASDNIPVFPVPGGLPPRAALPHLLGATHFALEQIGLIKNRADLDEAVALLQKKRTLYAPESPARSNLPKQITLKLLDKIPVIAGGPGVTAAAALRWKGQLNENSKIPAFDFFIPESNHNAIVPFGEMRKGQHPFVLVMLRDTSESPRMMKRFDITKSIVATHVDGVVDVWAEGSSTLARLLSLVYIGDYVSLYLALMRGLDPTPVPAIDRLKRELGR